jgi:hypothetical protein
LIKYKVRTPICVAAVLHQVDSQTRSRHPDKQGFEESSPFPYGADLFAKTVSIKNSECVVALQLVESSQYR